MTAKLLQFPPRPRRDILSPPRPVQYPFYVVRGSEHGLPHKFPASVKWEPSGEVCILEGQVWQMNGIPDVYVTVLGLLPDEKKVVFHLYRDPEVLHLETSTRVFRKLFTLRDLVPD